MPATARAKAEIKGRIDARQKELLDLVAKKAGLNVSDLFEEYAAVIIKQNKDLLTTAEKRQFSEFFPGTK